MNKEYIRFNKEQYKYLKELFPTYVLPPSSTEREYAFYFGQRAVLEAIRQVTIGEPKVSQDEL